MEESDGVVWGDNGAYIQRTQDRAHNSRVLRLGQPLSHSSWLLRQQGQDCRGPVSSQAHGNESDLAHTALLLQKEVEEEDCSPEGGRHLAGRLNLAVREARKIRSQPMTRQTMTNNGVGLLNQIRQGMGVPES